MGCLIPNNLSGRKNKTQTFVTVHIPTFLSINVSSSIYLSIHLHAYVATNCCIAGVFIILSTPIRSWEESCLQTPRTQAKVPSHYLACLNDVHDDDDDDDDIDDRDNDDDDSDDDYDDNNDDDDDAVDDDDDDAVDDDDDAVDDAVNDDNAVDDDAYDRSSDDASSWWWWLWSNIDDDQYEYDQYDKEWCIIMMMLHW